MTSEETKARILEAATRVFSHNGFAAAHVAEIADEAAVNVALIYRYFESKESLLHAVLDQFVNEAAAFRKKFITGSSLPATDEELFLLADWAWEFLQERQELIRVILFELLNDQDQLDLIYKFFDSILVERLPASLVDRRNEQSLLIGLTAFFYGLLPFLMVIAIGDQWAEHYQLPPEGLKQHFVAAFNRLFARHLMDVLDTENESTDER